MTRKAAVTLHFFPAGDDLPIFSGAPAVAHDRPFVAQPSAKQSALFDLRPDPFAVHDEEFPIAQDLSDGAASAQA